MIIPEVYGKLNCKQISLRKNMKELNREVDTMTQTEFGCSFMTGTKKKSTKKVEELKQESEYTELLCQIEQEKKDLIARQAALNAHKAILDNQAEELQAKEEELLKTQNTLSEWQGNLEQREIAVQDLEDQKKAVLQEREAIKQKEAQLDEAVRAVSEMPTLDACVEKVLDVAFVRIKSSPESPETFNFVARRYLERLQEDQKEQAEEICKTVRRTAPDYTFDTQPEDGMEF